MMRNGQDVTTTPDPGHPDDALKENTVALDPGESVIVYRGFRDFTGLYVGHCHNLAHEDHAMMFGWEITRLMPSGDAMPSPGGRRRIP
ncbi:UNVERIFIED_ORG: FtsP/CotA-like multicopper oxidase with cupredoxin domain [Arthrobacter globiformis]|nr:FtsP/CotA-like multicopper oxidase with cupredoxin domain [Arthrobacter globiformis]